MTILFSLIKVVEVGLWTSLSPLSVNAEWRQDRWMLENGETNTNSKLLAGVLVGRNIDKRRTEFIILSAKWHCPFSFRFMGVGSLGASGPALCLKLISDARCCISSLCLQCIRTHTMIQLGFSLIKKQKNVYWLSSFKHWGELLIIQTAKSGL